MDLVIKMNLLKLHKPLLVPSSFKLSDLDIRLMDTPKDPMNHYYGLFSGM